MNKNSTNTVKPKVPLTRRKALGFVFGFLILFRGLRFVYRDHRELARLYVPPMILAIVLLVGGWVFFALNIENWINALWREPPQDTWWGIQHVAWKALAFLVWIILALATALLSSSTFTVLAAPFSDLISERVEGILGTWDPKPFSVHFIIKDVGQTIRFELTRLAIKLAWIAPLFVLSLIFPIVGQALYVGLGGYLLSKFTGMDYIDWCAARRGWTWQERFAFARTYRFTLAGFGLSVVLSLMIPLAFVFVWPAAIASGAMLFNELYDENENNPRRLIP